MAGRVNQIELISLTIARRVHHANGMGLDGNAAFPLQVHGIEHLRLHFACGERTGQLEQAIGQRGLAVVNVRNDGEVSDVLGIHGSVGYH